MGVIDRPTEDLLFRASTAQTVARVAIEQAGIQVKDIGAAGDWPTRYTPDTPWHGWFEVAILSQLNGQLGDVALLAALRQVLGQPRRVFEFTKAEILESDSRVAASLRYMDF